MVRDEETECNVRNDGAASDDEQRLKEEKKIQTNVPCTGQNIMETCQPGVRVFDEACQKGKPRDGSPGKD